MKPLLTLFVIALLVSGCNTLPPNTTPPEPSISKLPLCSKTRPRGEPRGPCLDSKGNPNSLQMALVIGNSEYGYQPLPNPVNDAKGMTDALVKLGFYVTQANNLSHQNMTEVVKAFEKRLSGTPESVALFYFSGHGAQVGGQNFLLPVNNRNIRREEDLKQQAIMVQDILTAMQTVNKGMNLIVLDACRDNPYKLSESSIIKNANRGLTQVQLTAIPQGALVAFAAAPGQIALDGDGHYGLYTSHLLNELKRAEHRRIEEVFKDVRKSVATESQQKQVPWYHASVAETFCFKGCPQSVVPNSAE